MPTWQVLTLMMSHALRQIQHFDMSDEFAWDFSWWVNILLRIIKHCLSRIRHKRQNIICKTNTY